MLGAGNLPIGVGHYSVRDLLLLESLEGFIKGTWEIQAGYDKLSRLVGQDYFLIVDDPLESRGKGHDGIDFFLHCD
jgi:hypothetical protein